MIETICRKIDNQNEEDFFEAKAVHVA